MYRRLKARHIDGAAPAEKTSRLPDLGRTVAGDAECVVERLVECGLAVRRGPVAMWRPLLSDELTGTLRKIRAGTAIDGSDSDAAECLTAIGLVVRDGAGYRYPWGE